LRWRSSGWISSTKAPTPSGMILEKLAKPSITITCQNANSACPKLMVIDGEEQLDVDWMEPIQRVARKSCQYVIIDEVLFHQGANRMLMKCIWREENVQLLKDITKEYVILTPHIVHLLAKLSGTSSTLRQVKMISST
jgi:hypothetical protein